MNTNTVRGCQFLAVAAAVTCTDLWFVWRGHGLDLGLRVIPAIVATATYVVFVRGDLNSVGLRLRPIQGLRYWSVATLVIGACVGAFIFVAGVFFLISGRPLPVDPTRPEDFGPEFLRMCLLGPIVEEAIYRLGLCIGALPLLGPKGTIAASGLVFGALHILYGNPGPDNLVAGFFLAWAFLKSGSILVPIGLHSLGNLCALLAHVGTWYWLQLS